MQRVYVTVMFSGDMIGISKTFSQSAIVMHMLKMSSLDITLT